VHELTRQHAEDQVLIIGQYLDQLKDLADELDAPLLTGRTNTTQRQKLYDAFRRGELKRLVVSKVANFAIDLPDANVAIQVSGTFGSRQEEAQRLGRLLRPKPDGKPAHFYTIVTRDTRDQEFSANRQLFLTEQGYRYTIEDAEQLFPPDVIQRAMKPSANGQANGRVNGHASGSAARANNSSPRVKRPRSPNGSPNGAPTRSSTR
jgi:DNA excision repair protein ERCC-3